MMDIIMISGACCIPSMANLDELARKVIDEALSVTGIQAKVSTITAGTAYRNGAFRALIKKGIGMSDAPFIVIDGELVSYGVPKIEELKSALIKHSTK